MQEEGKCFPGSNDKQRILDTVILNYCFSEAHIEQQLCKQRLAGS